MKLPLMEVSQKDFTGVQFRTELNTHKNPDILITPTAIRKIGINRRPGKIRICSSKIEALVNVKDRLYEDIHSNYTAMVWLNFLSLNRTGDTNDRSDNVPLNFVFKCTKIVSRSLLHELSLVTFQGHNEPLILLSVIALCAKETYSALTKYEH